MRSMDGLLALARRIERGARVVDRLLALPRVVRVTPPTHIGTIVPIVPCRSTRTRTRPPPAKRRAAAARAGGERTSQFFLVVDVHEVGVRARTVVSSSTMLKLKLITGRTCADCDSSRRSDAE